MGDENPIRTLGDYSKPIHEGYMNTIELPIGNNVDLALYANESWNDLKDFAKLVKAIALPQNVPSTSDHRLIELENQVQRLMEAHLSSTKPTQASSRTDEVGGLVSSFMASQDARLSKFEADFKQNKKDDNSRKEEPEAGEKEVEYFDVFPARSELAYHKYLIYDLIPLIFLRNPIIMEGCPSNLKIPCNIGHAHVEKAYIDLNSPLNIMTRMMYNWITRRKLDPRENANGGVSNLIGRIKGMHIFIGNFTYVVDFMIVEDISSIIDPRLSQVVLGRPFVEVSKMTHDPPEGVVRFTNGNNEVAYKMPHKIEQ
ncbi:retrotransposon ORF1 [Tanacetum coccineum]